MSCGCQSVSTVQGCETTRKGLVFVDCNGIPHGNGAMVPSCAQTTDMINQALGGLDGSPVGVRVMQPGAGGMFVINQDTKHPFLPNAPAGQAGGVFVADTNDGGWAKSAGRCIFTAEFTSYNFFTQNPGAQIFIGLRCKESATEFDTHGALLGKIPFPGQPGVFSETPNICLFSKPDSSGVTIDRRIPETVAGLVLFDNQKYRIVISSAVGYDTAYYLRYQVFAWSSATGQWRLITDSGDVLDTNRLGDMKEPGIFIGWVNGVQGKTWSIAWENSRVQWGPFGSLALQNTFAAIPAEAEILTGYQVPLVGTSTWKDNTVHFETTHPNELLVWNTEKTVATFLEDMRVSISGTMMFGCGSVGGSGDFAMQMMGELFTGGQKPRVLAGSVQLKTTSAGGFASDVATFSQEAFVRKGDTLKVFATCFQENVSGGTPYFFVGRLPDALGQPRTPPEDHQGYLCKLVVSQIRS